MTPIGGRGRAVAHAAVIALALAGWGGRCGSATQPGELQLTWQDEFTGEAGALPDPTRWRFDVGTDWGNAQLEYDTPRARNAGLDGTGHLNITAYREDYQGRNYTSARITTAKLFSQTRGRFEARIRLPIGQGIWPAFWLLGANIDQVSWPTCGEIDIMEYRGQEPSVIHGSLHGPGYSGGAAITKRFTLPEGRFNDDYHVFAVDWTEESITWLVDNAPYRTVKTSDIPSGARWVFDHPFFVILNVAVGGNFVGVPNSTTTLFPQTMSVDWVRVYRVAP